MFDGFKHSLTHFVFHSLQKCSYISCSKISTLSRVENIMDALSLYSLRIRGGESLSIVKHYAFAQQLINNPKVWVYWIIFILLTLWLFFRVAGFVQRPRGSRPSTHDLEKPTSRISSFKVPERQ